MPQAIDPHQLLHGPYNPPALRRGDKATCLYRDGDVVITGWSDGRISWPRAASPRLGTDAIRQGRWPPGEPGNRSPLPTTDGYQARLETLPTQVVHNLLGHREVRVGGVARPRAIVAYPEGDPIEALLQPQAAPQDGLRVRDGCRGAQKAQRRQARRHPLP
jgi:hypothetical protein